MNIVEKSGVVNSPIKALFAFLMFAIVIGFILFSGRMWYEVTSSAQSELEFVNRMLMQNTNEVFNHHQSMLRILGERLLELDAGNFPERGRTLIDQMHRINPALAGFGLARNDGQLVLVSSVESGSELPNLLTQAESAKSFEAVLKTGQMQTGRTYYMKLLNRWVIPIRVAIKDNNGAIPLVMAAGIDIDAEVTTWNALYLPKDFEVRVLRSGGYWQFVKPLSDEDKATVYASKVESSFFDMIVSQNIGAGQVTFDYGGRIYLATYIEQWGMYSIVSLPRTYLIRNLISKLTIPTLLLAVFVIVGLVFYTIVSRAQRQYLTNLIKQATLDSLTSLPNRVLAMDRLEQAIEYASRSGQAVAVIYLDLDNFKRINDGFGHLIGDELLTLCGMRLKETIRSGDTVARLGGDEFLLILPSLINSDASDMILRKIHIQLDIPFVVGQREIFAHCSMGVALYPEDGAEPSDLLKAADTALYKAKDSGRRTHCFYSQQMNEEAERRVVLEAALRYALDKNELYPVYQLQIDMVDMRCTGAEVLMRWNSEELGVVMPDEFIPVAEETGLITDIGEFVLVNVCQTLALLQEHVSADFHMAINVSARQLREAEFLEKTKSVLREYNRQTSELVMEITESTLVDHPEQLIAIHELGIKLAIDDFGTGFSSLSYLSKYPIDILKIDRAFVRDIESDIQDANLASAIINMGSSLGLTIIAEGIETEGQMEFLKQSGCRYGQGFYISKPVPLDMFMTVLQQPGVQRA